MNHMINCFVLEHVAFKILGGIKMEYFAGIEIKSINTTKIEDLQRVRDAFMHSYTTRLDVLSTEILHINDPFSDLAAAPKNKVIKHLRNYLLLNKYAHLISAQFSIDEYEKLKLGSFVRFANQCLPDHWSSDFDVEGNISQLANSIKDLNFNLGKINVEELLHKIPDMNLINSNLLEYENNLRSYYNRVKEQNLRVAYDEMLTITNMLNGYHCPDNIPYLMGLQIAYYIDILTVLRTNIHLTEPISNFCIEIVFALEVSVFNLSVMPEITKTTHETVYENLIFSNNRNTSTTEDSQEIGSPRLLHYM